MKKTIPGNKLRRSAALLLCACLLLAGCGRGADASGAPIGYGGRQEGMVYGADRRFAFSGGDSAVLTGGFAVSASVRDTGYTLTFVSSSDGGEVARTELATEADYCRLISAGDGSVYVLVQTTGGKAAYRMYHASPDGGIQAVEGFDPGDIPEAPIPLMVKKAFRAGDGSLFVWCRLLIPARESGLRRHENAQEGAYFETSRIYVLDAGGAVKGYVNEPNEICAAGLCEDGLELLVNGEDGWYRETVSTFGKAGEHSDISPADVLAGGDASLAELSGEDVFFIRDNSIQWRNLRTGGKDRLVNLVSLGILQDDIVAFQRTGEEFEILTAGEYGAYYHIAAGAGRDGIYAAGGAADGVLTLAGVGLEYDQFLQKAVADFNRGHGEMRVELVDYLDDDHDFDSAYTRLKLDIARGNIPDILHTDAYMDASMLGSRGLLCNLYDFMDKDAKFSRDAFVGSALKACEEGGKLYSLSPRFSLFTISGPRRILGDRVGVSMEEFRSYLQGKNNGKKRYFSCYRSEDALRNFLSEMAGQYIDWPERTCHFNSREFHELLKFVKDCQSVYNSDLQGDYVENMRDGTVVLKMDTVGSVADYQLQKEMFGDELTYIGYPGVSASGTGISMQMGQLAITSVSPEKEEAWEFFKYYCRNAVSTDRSYQWFSILNEKLEEQFMASKSSCTGWDEAGNSIRSVNRSYDIGGWNIEVFEATDEDVVVVRNLIESADFKVQRHMDILNIIEEECGAFLTGDKTAEEVSRIVQNRVQLYLNEG